MGGVDKAALRVGNVTLLENVLAAAAPLCSALVVVGPVRPTRLPGVVFTIESNPGGGPVPAVVAGLEKAGGADAVFVLAADLALLSTGGLERLLAALGDSGAGAAAAAGENATPNPLLAVYRTTAVRSALEKLGPDPRGIAAARLLPEDTVVVPMDPDETLNVNTQDDLRAAASAHQRRRS